MAQPAKVAVRRLGVPACTKEEYEALKKEKTKENNIKKDVK